MQQQNGTRVREVLGEMRAALAAGGVDDPETDAQLLVAHVLGVSRGRVQALEVLGAELDDAQTGRVRDLAYERARRVPLQHLTGRAPFRALELAVGPGVFVPRPETESVVQLAIDALREMPVPDPIVVDLCTGSGAIALAIATEVAGARVRAVEKSPEAHAWAERNVAEWGQGRVELLLGDVAAPELLEDLSGRVDLLISNPPYVPTGMVPRDPEVRDHDPELALYSGEDGLDLIRIISRAALRLVRAGGVLVLEHAEHQGAAIRNLLRSDGWRLAATHPDLTGRDRSTTAVRYGVRPAVKSRVGGYDRGLRLLR